MTPTIAGENVALRPIIPDDYPLLVKWTLDPDVGRFLDGDYPRSLADCPAWHQKIRSDRHRQVFGIELLNGLLIGDIELDHIAWRSGDGELRVRIGEKAQWGKGYGSEAVTLLLAYAFGSLNLRRVYLRVFAANERAVRCYRRVGFRQEGFLVRRTGESDRREVILMRMWRKEFLRRHPERARAS
ncbi:MAG: GNAT family N-acetyltransferase [Firmicutes bacterium]|nr:GNAT family N-acetyltransferase [Bacillota bacterium]